MKSDQNATEVIPLVMLFFIQRICCFCFIIQKCNSDNELKALRSQIPVSERSEKVCSLYTAHFLQRSLDTAIFAMDSGSSSHDNQISILSLLLIFSKSFERNKLRTVHLKGLQKKNTNTMVFRIQLSYSFECCFCCRTCAGQMDKSPSSFWQLPIPLWCPHQTSSLQLEFQPQQDLYSESNISIDPFFKWFLGLYQGEIGNFTKITQFSEITLLWVSFCNKHLSSILSIFPSSAIYSSNYMQIERNVHGHGQLVSDNTKTRKFLNGTPVNSCDQNISHFPGHLSHSSGEDKVCCLFWPAQ